MSKSEQFREYAKEALDWARRSKTENEREAYIDIARTWTLAATWSDTPLCWMDGQARLTDHG
jgi:hypothetical protein